MFHACGPPFPIQCTGQEGDALKWQYGGSKMSMSSTSSTYTVTYTISYYTTGTCIETVGSRFTI